MSDTQPPSKEETRISCQITRATVQITIFTKCLKLVVLQGTGLGESFPLFCQDNVCKQTSSEESSYTQQRSHKNMVEYFLLLNWGRSAGMDDVDKVVFGQHPAQNESVISGISKVRNRDPGQQNHGMRQWLWVTELLSKLQLLWLSAGGTCC